MVPIGEKVQIEHTLRSLWFIYGGSGNCNPVILSFPRSDPESHSDTGLVDVWEYELANMRLTCRLRWHSCERLRAIRVPALKGPG